MAGIMETDTHTFIQRHRFLVGHWFEEPKTFLRILYRVERDLRKGPSPVFSFVTTLLETRVFLRDFSRIQKHDGKHLLRRSRQKNIPMEPLLYELGDKPRMVQVNVR